MNVEIIAHHLMIIGGIFMYFFGSIGNLLNIYVFTIWYRSKHTSHKCARSNRTSNSSLYLLASSISNLIVIVYPLFTRIMLDGYEYHLTASSVFFVCQFRYFILHIFDLTSLACICLATFDRYLISSRTARLRKLSPTKKQSKYILLFVVCLFTIHSIPNLKYYHVSRQGYCAISSHVYLYYYLYSFQIFLHGIFPIVFLSIFGTLTFRQLKTINRRKSLCRNSHIDRQLSRMILLISIAIVLSSIPYCIEQSYYVLFNNNNRSATPFFFLYHVTCSILFYTNPVSSFYIYYVSTRNFRAQVNQIICCRRTVHCDVFYQIRPIITPRQSVHDSLF